jgi:alanine racemase
VTQRAPAPRIHVDLDAVRHNLRVFADAVQVPVIAIVKANAYGHGMVEVGRAALAAGASALGVADVDEALALRAAGITAPVIAWLDAPSIDFGAAVEAGIELGFSSPQHLAMLADWIERESRVDGPVRVHIKLDTGLGRNGVREPDWPAMFTLASDYEARGYLEVRGFMSHFSGTSDSDDAEQIAAFDRATALAETFGLQPSLRHLAATAGALRFPEARYDATRLGIALYGLDPIAPDARCGLELRPALTLTAHAATTSTTCPAGCSTSARSTDCCPWPRANCCCRTRRGIAGASNASTPATALSRRSATSSAARTAASPSSVAPRVPTTGPPPRARLTTR